MSIALPAGEASDEPPGRSTVDRLCRPDHPATQPGSFSERERRLSWEELAVARILVSEGHHVRARKERPGFGKTADFDVCGVATEVKTLEPGATSATLANAIKRGREQGEVVIVNATNSGLPRHWAERGIDRFASKGEFAKLAGLRILGAGYDLSYRRDDLARRAERPGPDLGLSR